MKIGYAIELLFNNEFNEYVRNIWDKCAQNNYSNHMQTIEGDVMPHITLSVYEGIDDDDIAPLFTRYKHVKENKAHFSTNAVCMFKATKVTYLNVNVNRDMLNYFEDVYHFFTALSDNCSKYYLPQNIVPHISVAQCDTIEDAKKCWSFVVDHFEAQDISIEKIALVKLYFDDERKLKKCELMDEKVLS